MTCATSKTIRTLRTAVPALKTIAEKMDVSAFMDGGKLNLKVSELAASVKSGFPMSALAVLEQERLGFGTIEVKASDLVNDVFEKRAVEEEMAKLQQALKA